ncbi:related to FMP22 Found in Mitochondrial Proteome [Cephalotrichum gorgonifer]|uniref:Related to FMP22 Found in Mitochondrial Proteome n=1 Tax=Cephalotrichum gorgonifer TaxID=2041049 RepID=A0AAE8MRG8_9PEZI|nr:related to FMP22 Found in Mitochondrial Proteome [Cephalotrichum gorgonifer]
MSTRTLLRPALRAARHAPASRTFLSRAKPPHRATDNLNVRRLADSRSDYERDRRAFLTAGVLAGVIGIVYTSMKLKEALSKKTKLDSKIPAETFTVDGGTKRKVVVHDEYGNEIVPTGNSTVPTFPRTIDLSKSSDGLPATAVDDLGTQYTLVGLGVRTVSFLSIQVYVVGFYVATSDITKLQSYLVKKVNGLATTLVSGEKEELRKTLLDPERGEETWDSLLREAGCRSAFRIVPVRDTDFHHMRDAFVRAITARSKGNEKYEDDGFGEAIQQLKRALNRGKVPKTDELLLCRDGRGFMRILYDEKKEGRKELGTVPDERVSRLLWLNYLAGKKVASEGTRHNIVDGLMEFVERPIGTVAAQVV